MSVERITSASVFRALLNLDWVRRDRDLLARTGLVCEHACMDEIKAILKAGLDDSISYVARENNGGNIQGFLLGEPYDKNHIYLARILVSPEHRRKNIGLSLVAAFVASDEARSKTSIVETSADNIYTRRILKQFGFCADPQDSTNNWICMKRPPTDDINALIHP